MARAEVYIVGHDQNAYAEVKNKGLNPETILRPRLNEQIPAYLGEFVLDVKFKEFSYDEVTDPQTGQKELHAPGFIGEISKSYDRAVWDAKSRGWSGEREIAECEGFKTLEKQLFESPDGTFFLWISPPGSKEEGYGDYSFTHLGQIRKTVGGRRIEVTSVRNKLALEEHAQIINHFLPEEKKLKNPKDTDFLRNPVVIEGDDNYTRHDLLVSIDVILKETSGRASHLAKAYQEKEDWENNLLKILQPMIDDYYRLVEEGASRDELQRTIWTIENYTKEMLSRETAVTIGKRPISVAEQDIAIMYRQWGYEPKALAGGGCPTGSSRSTKDLFSSSASLPWQEHQLENSHSGEGKKTLECTCPNCNQKVKAVIEGGKIHCPACGASAPYEC